MGKKFARIFEWGKEFINKNTGIVLKKNLAKLLCFDFEVMLFFFKIVFEDKFSNNLQFSSRIYIYLC